MNQTNTDKKSLSGIMKAQNTTVLAKMSVLDGNLQWTKPS